MATTKTTKPKAAAPKPKAVPQPAQEPGECSQCGAMSDMRKNGVCLACRS